MRQTNTSFKFDLGAVSRFGDKLGQKMAQTDKILQKRMELATSMVWRIAHQKRPMITKAQMRAEGRSKRVSDPAAQLGVPVDTGALQASIQQKVTRSRLMTFVGEIWTRGIKYAGYMEYGTSKIAPRPFMRPAINVNREAIKRLFKMKIDSNL